MTTEFTPEWIKEQIEKFHNSTSDEWLTDCWNNYGLALEEIQRLQARVQELEAEQRWIPVSSPPPKEIGFNSLSITVIFKLFYGAVPVFAYYDFNEKKWFELHIGNEIKRLGDKARWTYLPKPPKDGE